METFEFNLNRVEVMRVLHSIDTRIDVLRKNELFQQADDYADLGIRIRCAAESQGWS